MNGSATRKFFLISCFLCCLLAGAGLQAQTAVVRGVVTDAAGKGIEQAVVAVQTTGLGTQCSPTGAYTLEVPCTDNTINLVYYLAGYKMQIKRVKIKEGDTTLLNVMLQVADNVGTEVIVVEKNARNVPGLIQLDVSKIPYRPDAVGGVEGIIKSYVGTNNELTSQYSVRGGNFDENLVYVNDFEIYRPFLVRTGQQEGLSFVNSDLVANVQFSVGGFQAKYGDKMSSVLDVSYKRPKKTSASVMLSLLGANVHVEGISKNKRFTYLIGARQKSNQYILQAQPTKGVYNPSFTDLQALLNYKISKSWEMEVIGNYARNRFTFFPETRVSSFGFLNQAYQLNVYYAGAEYDQFDSRFAGISFSHHKTGSLWKWKFLASGFQTNEYETYDIGGEYLFGELQTDKGKSNFGQIKTYLGTGYIHNFARNYLTVNVGNMGFKGNYDGGRHYIQLGTTATATLIDDALHEWERRDSAAFNQPYNPNELRLSYFFHSSASFQYTRIAGYVQDNIRLDSAGRLTANAGIRYNYSLLNNELLISPRLQMSWKPRVKNDIIYKFATGVYGQPPFYREMRDLNGNVNKELKAQKSWQTVLGADVNFKFNKRDFKTTVEVYYKHLWDSDPYFYDNVRIRYTGKNNAIGSIYGIEARLFGELVKDATSWISIGVLKAQQKIIDSPSIDGYNNYFPLPSDQRFMLGMYFEDYLRKRKNYKAHINLMYSTGLPVGPPTGKLYQNSLRLPDYKRVDIGFSAMLLNAEKKKYKGKKGLKYFRSIWASLEVFNLLSIQNTLSYTWIQDNSTNNRYAVPNRLTTRLINLKTLINL
ncbi:MAG: TonB-dependent receptor [Chitinophagia bacterium]|nr:TonB-dependent receptor [Chitinophagia bacterium]